MRFARSTALLGFAGVIVLLSSSHISAQDRSTVSGFVTGPDKRPVARARVEMTNDATFNVHRTETDQSGRYAFMIAGTGRFTLRVTAINADLAEQSQSIEIEGGARTGSDSVQVDFQLRSRNNSATTTAAVVFAQDVPEEARKYFESAKADLAQSNSSAAMAALQKALTVFPTYFAALELIGVEHMKKKEYREGGAAFEQAVAINPRSFNCMYGLAYAYLGLDMFADAVRAAHEATLIDKNAPQAFFVLGMAHRQVKAYEASEKAFLRAKELDRGATPDIHWNLALLYGNNMLRYGKAADELELFLKATPNNPEAANIKKVIASFRSKKDGVK